MKAFTISAAVAILAAFAQAAPTPAQNDARQFKALITFEGATPEAFYTRSVPTDGSVFTIGMSFANFHVCLVPIIPVNPSISQFST